MTTVYIPASFKPIHCDQSQDGDMVADKKLVRQADSLFPQGDTFQEVLENYEESLKLMTFIQMELAVIEDIEGAAHDWWTAATDVGINGQWFWIASRADVEDFVWYTDQPNPSHADYNCMFLSSGANYLGYSAPCDSSIFPICQLK